MAVRSRNTTPNTSRPRVGFLRPGHVEYAFIWLLYLALLLLVLLSVLGTFYGRRGTEVPIATPLQIVADIFGDPTKGIAADLGNFGIAVAIQGVLTLIQYGARQKAKDDRRWWILYLVALGWSVYYNILGYWTPLTAIAPWYLAALLIVAGDVLPEFLAVQRE